MTKPNVVSEAPPGVARNAGVEGVDGRSPASKRQSRARERKCLATGPASATGEGVRGTCATSPGAIRRPKARRSLPSGHPACACTQKLLPSGQFCLFLRQCKAEYKTHARFESGDESYSRRAGTDPSAPHSKDASRQRSKPPSLQNLHKKRKKLQYIVDIYKKVWYNKSNGWKSRLWKVEY